MRRASADLWRIGQRPSTRKVDRIGVLYSSPPFLRFNFDFFDMNFFLLSFLSFSKIIRNLKNFSEKIVGGFRFHCLLVDIRVNYSLYKSLRPDRKESLCKQETVKRVTTSY